MKVGQKVYDLEYGWGKVVNINETESYPIAVNFVIGVYEYYTKEGTRSSYGNRMLFNRKKWVI